MEGETMIRQYKSIITLKNKKDADFIMEICKESKREFILIETIETYYVGENYDAQLTEKPIWIICEILEWWKMNTKEWECYNIDNVKDWKPIMDFIKFKSDEKC